MPTAIMLQDHETLGERGTVVDVSKGYLRNYLIPRKLAEPATKGSIAAAQRRQVAADRALEEATSKARDNAELLNKTVLTITHQAGDDGRLFGSVTTQDIVDAIRDARGIRIDKRKVHLDEPIKTVGTRMVVVEVADASPRPSRRWSSKRSSRAVAPRPAAARSLRDPLVAEVEVLLRRTLVVGHLPAPADRVAVRAERAGVALPEAQV